MGKDLMRAHVMRRVFTLMAGIVLVAIPRIASAHGGNNDPNVVHACIGNISKIVRIVGVSGSCLSSPPVAAETPADWDIQGPQGAPGVNGTNGTRAAAPCFDNTKRYVDCGNGTVTDTVTGLIWLKQSDCLGSARWDAANQAAAGLKDGDCTLTDGSSPGDWRLPTKAEWEATIARAVALGCEFGRLGGPSLTNDAGTACYGMGTGSSFAGVASAEYWSSTADGPGAAWGADLLYGSVGRTAGVNKDWTLRVWPVRGGPR